MMFSAENQSQQLTKISVMTLPHTPLQTTDSAIIPIHTMRVLAHMHANSILYSLFGVFMKIMPVAY
jgi:hypothetical protein